MPKIPVKVAPFELESTYACNTSETISSDGSKTYAYSYSARASTSSCTKEFQYTLPNGSEIKSAAIYADLEKPSFDGSTTINGVEIAANETKTVSAPVDIDGLAITGTISIPFTYTCYDGLHQHAPSGTPNSTVQQGPNTVNTYKFTHPSTLKYTNVYLEITYSRGSYIYYAEGDKLVQYQIYHAEDDKLVPYQLFHAENNELIQY